MNTEWDTNFTAMGCQIRLLLGDGALPPEEMGEQIKQWLTGFDSTLTRFDDNSELMRFNRDPQSEVLISPSLMQLIKAALETAEASGGLVDPTLLSDLQTLGYTDSFLGQTPASLSEALACAPERHPAQPSSSQNWQAFTLNENSGSVTRPPGIQIDSGGVGKGLAVDLIAQKLTGWSRFLIDCGGDIRVGGVESVSIPYQIQVAHPLRADCAYKLALGPGAVATSGIDKRIWGDVEQGFAHHLLNPSTAQPVWSGVIAATALAADCVVAERLSKQALLAGPETGAEILKDQGGLLILDSGEVIPIGAIRHLGRSQ